MRLRKNRRFIVVLLSFLALTTLRAQTLYWVGGSGNFNDPTHWSLTSGGPSSSTLPDSTSHLVFDNSVGIGITEVYVNSTFSVQSIFIESENSLTFKKTGLQAKLVISKSFVNLFENFNSTVTFEFTGLGTNSSNIGVISLGTARLNNNVNVTGGQWMIGNLKLQESNTITINNAGIEFRNSILQAGKLSIQNSSALNFNRAILRISKILDISKNSNMQVGNSYLNKVPISSSDLNSTISVSSGKYSGSQTNALCLTTPTVVRPSCSPGCDGSIIITLPPFSCFAPYYPQTITAYNVDIPSTGTCSALGSLTNVSPGTYTISSVCSCTTAYNIIVQDQTGAYLDDISASVIKPSITPVTLSTRTIACNGACTGSVNLAFVGGSSPYNFTVSPPTGSVYTTSSSGGLSMTNLCAGILSITVVDNNLCAVVHSTLFASPTAILSSSVATNVLCKNACNGTLAITPSQGANTNYTVSFSNGLINTTSSGVAVNSGSLCPGPITATITDAKSCSITVSANITEPSSLIATTSQTNVFCNGGSTGIASILASGGTTLYTYVWNPAAGNTSVVTGLSNGPITVTVTDQNSCSLTANYTITESTPITYTTSKTNVVCSGSCTGVASLTVQGGQGSYNIVWVGPSSSNTISTGSATSISNLCAGTYTAYITDGYTCSPTPATFAITQPPTFSVSAISRSITCFGANNGGATVTATGGNSASYSYVWTPSLPTSSVVNGLAQGLYTVAVSDAASCVKTTTVLIQEPAGVTPNVVSTSLTCNVGNAPCNGVITATPSGGIPPYSYTLVSVTSNTNAPPYNNLCAANYSLIIRDNSLCSQTISIALAQPALLQPSVLTTSVSCFSGTNGALNGNTGNGGTGPYTTYFSSLSGTNSANPLTGQGAGTYTFHVVDSRSCTASAIGTILQPTQMSVTVNSSSITCFSVCNGSLSSTVSGGVGPYTYAWTNSLNVVVSTAATASALCNGSYTLTVLDNNLCTRTVVASVTSPPPITSTISTTPVTCFGASTGSATVIAGGGVGSFTFSFNSAPTVSNTTGILVGQPTGTYIATVTDNNSCVHTKTFSIATPAALAANLTGAGSCVVCSGSTTLTPSFGTAGYTYSWTSSLGGPLPTTPTLSGLCPGTYTGTVTDSKGCFVVRTITLTQIVSVTVVPSGQSILCNGAATGSAAVSASGGSGSYTYSWSTSPTQTNSSVTGVVAGTYTVRVTDTSTPACSHTAAVVLTQPNLVTITIPPPTSLSVTCYGFTNAAITATVTGGTPGTNPNPPYTYTWSPNSINSSTNSVTGLAAGPYTLTVRDFYGCSMSKTMTVTQPTIINIGVAKSNPTVCASTGANGSFTVIASAGQGGPYGYTLTPPGTANTTGLFTGLAGGSYSIQVKDGPGCVNSTVTSLVPPSAPNFVIATTSVACYGYSTGVISATASGVSATSFVFAWTPAVTNVTTTTTTTRATSLVAGQLYIISATDNNGCTNSQTVMLNQPLPLAPNATVTNLSCFNAPTGSIVVAPSGGTPAYSYTWLPPGLTGSNTATVTALAAGVYTLNLSDTHTCTTPFTFTVTQPAAIVLTGTTTNLTCYSVCAGAITASASGGAGFINYSWAPAAGSSSVISNLCATTGTTPIIYTVTAVDANTCSATKTFSLTQPTPITSSINVLSATCSNSCNAIATQTASGGTPGYSYSWSSSSVTTSSLGSLCAGVYTAYVSDANSCVTEKQFIVSAPLSLSVTLIPSNPLCNASCDGSITTVISNAQGSVTYSWSPSGIGQNPTGLCATFTPSSTYTLLAIDGNSCEVTAVTTLTNPPALIASVNFTNPLCSTLSYTSTDGSASAIATNAFGALSYTWLPTGSPTKTTQTISGLGAGTYSLFISDANSCQASTSFTLNNAPTFSVNTIITPASCSQSNGAVTAIASGGTPGTLTPYTYSWTGSANTTSVLTGIFAGVYTLTVNDSHACTATLGVALSNQNGPSTMPLITNSITCNAQCTGAASVDVSNVVGGTGPYTATWTAPSSANVALTNLCAGSYIAQITDATGCIGFTTAVISEPPPIVATPSISLPICPGICNGSISVDVTGGITPYVYSWMGTSSTNSAVTGLCAGDYTFVVEYNGVCTDTTRLNLPDQSSLTIAPSVTNVVCFGASTGKIDLTITGGTPPYSAGWNNSSTGYPLVNISAGSYTAIITDNNGCSNVATASVTQGAQIISTAAITSPSCGLCNGTASVTASGGVGPFTYNWSTSATGSIITNVCAGIYQVTATDNLSCSQTNTVIVNNSNGITGETTNVQNIPCSGSCIGAATVTPIGGTAPISFSWINPVSTNSVISGLCPGTYYVQMSDAQSCIRIASVTIDPQITLTVSPFVYLPFCAQPNGSISITVAGGTPTYNIVWNPPAGSSTSITGLDAGVYSYTVTESGPNACSVSNTINLSNTNAPVLQATQSNINCFNACTGSISTSASGTNTPITFLWSNASTSSVVTNLCKGPITLTVTDFGGCKTIQSFTVTENPLLQLGIPNLHNSTCFGDCNGSVNLIPNGGVAPYTYSWSLANANANPITSLCDGVYSGTVTDSKGCSVASPSYTIISASALSLTANTFSSSCSAVADGSITLTVGGGQPNYTFIWNGPSSFTSAAQNINNIYSGSYSVNVLDNLGCSKSTVLEIVPSLSVSSNAGEDKIICPLTGTVLLQATSSGGSTSYRWYAAEDLQKTFVLGTGDTYLVKNLQERHDFVLLATSAVASCYSEDQVSVGVFDNPPVDAGRDQMIPIYSTVTIGGRPSSFSAVSLTWSPALYLDDSTISNPVASNTIGITYTLTVTDGNGCMASDTVQVNLYPELNITSGFTPNGDGKNDTWIIDYIDQFPATTVDIFNRWGDSVFSSTGYITPFDGKYKGAELPVGTYYYVIKLNHPGYPKPITGPLTIFR
ncbi:hypothetical protein CNR22_06390 [Sphingobacteriaceae bacterium]|nr:hypothetical protein CNR22_06390 [Sphingobacteriaceae bacterium]